MCETLITKLKAQLHFRNYPLFFTHVVTFPALLTLPNPQLSEDIFFWVLGNSGQTRVTTWTTSTPWDGPEVAHYKYCSAFRISKDNLNIPFSWTNIHTKATEHHSGVVLPFPSASHHTPWAHGTWSTWTWVYKVFFGYSKTKRVQEQKNIPPACQG